VIAYAIRRSLLAVPTLILVSVIVFVMMRSIPGDPASLQIGDNSSREQVQALREQLGLDKPVYQQYFVWVSGVLRGDFGNSLRSRQPVIDDLVHAIPVSAELAVVGMVFAIIVAIPLGILAATQRGQFIDYVARVIAVAGLSIPSFILGTLVVLCLALWFGWLPPPGFTPFYKEPWTNVQQFFFPALVVGYRSSALTTRMIRSELLEVLNHDYVRTAVAKGLSGRAVVVNHALRNALIPVVTLIGTQVGTLLAGAVITETIFSLPGVGHLFIVAVSERDYTLVQVIVLFVAVVVTLCNLLVDLLYGFLDPKIRYS